jgi:acetyl esterase/lipase
MSRWPRLAAWRSARRLGITLSLRDHLAGLRRPNVGGPHPERTVAYGSAADGTTLALDVWAAAGEEIQPAVVKVHGGGWTEGSRNEAEQWNHWLNGLGYHIFDIEYRLAPPARWRDAVGDVKAALGWVATHAAEQHVDPARISLMGHSAGGHLALLAAYSAGEPQLPPSCESRQVDVRCVINIYGPCDLTHLYGSSHGIDACLRQYVGGTPAEHPDRYRTVSPLTYVDAATPPTITVIGQRDRMIPVDQAQLLDDALSRAGVAHETCIVPGDDHGFDINWGGFGTQIARARVERFLRQHG